jgi:hypothetical protein
MGLVLDPRVVWINPIDKVSVAEHKLYQLQVAVNLGFRVPRTLVSSDLDMLRGFAADNAVGTICKPIFHGMFFDGLSRHSVYTRRLEVETLDAASLQACPVLIQEEVPRIADVRATFIGNRCFVADIRGDASLVDWRGPHVAVDYAASSIDDTTTGLCRRMLRDLGLLYGAFDFIRTPAGGVGVPGGQSNRRMGLARRKIRFPDAQRVRRGVLRSWPLTPEFTAPPIRSAWPRSEWHLLYILSNAVVGFVCMLVQPLIPYESKPREPEPLPVLSRTSSEESGEESLEQIAAKSSDEATGYPSEEQLNQCQTIFDDSEATRSHLEQKAQWAFAIIGFLMTSLASVILFLIRDHAVQTINPMPLFLLSISACCLLLSFVSATRAIAIRGRQILGPQSVIDPDTGHFLKYDRAFHAQGLLYCATMNTSTNNHIADFVKCAHVLMGLAAITVSLGAVVTIL